MYERKMVAGGHGRGGVGIANGERLIELVRHFGRANDPVIRQKLAKVMIGFRVVGYLNARRDLPGDALVMSKLSLAKNLTDSAELVSEVLGPRIIADSGEWGTFAWTKFLLGAPGNHIAVGTDETIRNIIGERVLGLPKEPGGSNSDTCTRWPRPVFSRDISAAKITLLAIIAVVMSMIAGPPATTAPSLCPLICMKPVCAWAIGSKPARSARGPSRPAAETEQ